jgi:hypothetical protein
MNPFYNPSISTPHTWDVEAVRALYGAAKPANPTPPPVPPAPGSPKAFAGMFEIPANLPEGIYKATFSKV